jgi:hypothetical protein
LFIFAQFHRIFLMIYFSWALISHTIKYLKAKYHQQDHFAYKVLIAFQTKRFPYLIRFKTKSQNCVFWSKTERNENKHWKTKVFVSRHAIFNVNHRVNLIFPLLAQSFFRYSLQYRVNIVLFYEKKYCSWLRWLTIYRKTVEYVMCRLSKESFVW